MRNVIFVSLFVFFNVCVFADVKKEHNSKSSTNVTYLGGGVGADITTWKDDHVSDSGYSGSQKCKNDCSLFVIGGYGRAFSSRLMAAAEVELSAKGASSWDVRDGKDRIKRGPFSAGLFARLGYIFKENVTGHLLLGGKKSKIKYTPSNRADVSRSIITPAFGIGVERKLSKRLNFRSDLTYTFDKEVKIAGNCENGFYKEKIKNNELAFRMIGTCSI